MPTFVMRMNHMQPKSILLILNTLSELEEHLNSLTNERFFVLCDSNTWRECFPRIASGFSNRQCHIHIIPPGEIHKQADTLWDILRNMALEGLQKSDLVVNLGGGTISDIGGLASALYQRGLPYINLPTTLLAMADAAHGGKTAIDFMGIKNLVGTFWFPQQTIIFPEFLRTLPQRELKAGYVEVLKQALLAGKRAWAQASTIGPEQITQNPQIICRAAELKMKIVKQDPTDRGIRQILNLGHTLGHAIEAWSLTHPLGPMLHGEAVALGMMAELRLSALYAGLDEDFAQQASRVFSRFIHSPFPTISDIDQIQNFMRYDKKNRNASIRFSLLAKPGKAYIGVSIAEKKIRNVLEEILSGIHNP